MNNTDKDESNAQKHQNIFKIRQIWQIYVGKRNKKNIC